MWYDLYARRAYIHTLIMNTTVEDRTADTRGTTGLGVLILMISVILTAVIAAGIIIDATGHLQSTAQATGGESKAEISDRLSVLATSAEVISGDNASDPNQVGAVNLTVYRTPSAGHIDLQEVTIQYFSPYGTTFLLHEQKYADRPTDETTFTSDLGTFSIKAENDDDSSIPVLNTHTDRATVVIDLDSSSGPNTILEPLQRGDSATIQFTTQSGATTTEVITVPTSLNGKSGNTILL